MMKKTGVQRLLYLEILSMSVGQKNIVRSSKCSHEIYYQLEYDIVAIMTIVHQENQTGSKTTNRTMKNIRKKEMLSTFVCPNSKLNQNILDLLHPILQPGL